MQLEGIDHIALTVRDIRASAQWYLDVLGLERQYAEAWDGPPLFVGKGTTGLALFPVEGEATKAPVRNAITMLHFAFRATRQNFEAARKELEKRGIEFHFEDHGIAHSVYFPDPDGHRLEITTYETERAL